MPRSLSPSRVRPVLAALLAAATLTCALAAQADPGDSPDVEARRMLHLLGYVEVDYRNAVADGAIVSEAEYNEQLALLDEASIIAARLGPAGAGATDRASGADASLLETTRKARALVHTKSPNADVKAAIATARAELLRAFKLDLAPKTAPDRARGEALYLEHCATCHGTTGRADTPRAASLSPRPTDFQDPVVAETLSPARAAGTVRFGIAGTAMIPFTFLREADLWDLGFYAVSLRHGPSPSTASDIRAPAYALAELALRSDGEILDDLFAAGLREEDLPPALAALRARAPYEAARFLEGPVPLSRAAIARARLAIAWGDPSSARASAREAYASGIAPMIAALRPLDPELAFSIEARTLDLHDDHLALEDPADLDARAEALLRDLTRGDLELAKAADPPSAAQAALPILALSLREGIALALGLGALLGLRTQTTQRLPTWLKIAAPATAIAFSLVIARAAAALRSFGAPLPPLLFGAILGAIALAAAAILAARAARLLPPPAARILAAAALTLGALLFAERALARLQLAFGIPARATSAPAIPWLGVHATAQGIALLIVIALAFAAMLALPLAARRRAQERRADP